MKKILALALLLTAPLHATVPMWQNVPSTTTGTSLTYLSGSMKVYPSTGTAASSPALWLDAINKLLTVRSGVNVSTVGATGIYSPAFYGAATGLTAIPSAQLTGGIPVGLVNLSTVTTELADKAISMGAACAGNNFVTQITASGFSCSAPTSASANVLKAGDTMTGQLNGTSASYTGSVTVGSHTVTGQSYHGGDIGLLAGEALTFDGIVGGGSYGMQYKVVAPYYPLRFLGASDPNTNRHFEFGYYNGDTLNGSWNRRVNINSYTGDVNLSSGSLTVAGGTFSVGGSTVDVRAGRMGIGRAATAGTQLEVYDAGGLPQLDVTDGTLKSRIGSNYFRVYGSGGYLDSYGASNAGFNFRTSNASALDTTALVLTGSGNANFGGTGNFQYGITATSGTFITSGQAILTVKMTGASSGNNAALNLIGSGNGNWLIGTNRTDLAGAVDTLMFYKNAGTSGTKMVIQDNGNIGINNTTPQNKLSVTGDVAIGAIDIAAAANLFVTSSKAPTSYVLKVSSQDGTNQFATYGNGSAYMFGPVGIAGAIGADALTVTGWAKATTGIYSPTVRANTFYPYSDVGFVMTTYPGSAGDIVFKSSGTAQGETMRLDSVGRVGIGITPTAQLHTDTDARNQAVAKIGNIDGSYDRGLTVWTADNPRPGASQTWRPSLDLSIGDTGGYAYAGKMRFSLSANGATGKASSMLKVSALSNLDGYTTEADIMTWIGSGRVGIGTDAPTRTLDVTGIINTSQHYEIAGTTVLAVLPVGAGGLGVGLDAGRLSTGVDNTFVGYHSGYATTTGLNNTCLGSGTCQTNVTASYNTMLGYQAGSLTTGAENTFVGYAAGQSGVGANNVYVGRSAGQSQTSSNNNVGIGYLALNGSGSSSQNTAVGYYAGNVVTTGAGNTLIGDRAGANLTTGSNNIILGAQINTPAVGTSNYLNIGNLITGTVGSSSVTVQGLLGVTGNTALTTYTETKSSAAVSTSYDVSWASGSVIWLTLNASTTLTFSSPVSGKTMTFFVKQGGAGGYALTWPTISWPSGAAPTLTTTAQKVDIITVVNVDGVYYGFLGGKNY